MIALDVAQGVLYGKSGSSEVWIWWYAPAGEFVLTTRRSTGAVETVWLGATIGQQSIGKDTAPTDTPTAPDEGAHGVGSYPDGSGYAWHRKGPSAFTLRLYDNPELFMSWKLYDVANATMKTGVLGWAY